MFKEFFGFGRQNERIKQVEPVTKELTVNQQMRREAIEKLQNDLRTNTQSSEEVVTKRKEALIKLLEKEMVEEMGELTTSEDMHYSRPFPSASNKATAEDKKHT